MGLFGFGGEKKEKRESTSPLSFGSCLEKMPAATWATYIATTAIIPIISIAIHTVVCKPTPDDNKECGGKDGANQWYAFKSWLSSNAKVKHPNNEENSKETKYSRTNNSIGSTATGY